MVLRLSLLLFLSCLALVHSQDNAVTKGIVALFTQFDANKDGTLTLDEFFNGLLAMYDTSGDKQVGRMEFMTQWAKGNPHQLDAGNNIFDQVDSNNDKLWTRADIASIIKSMDLSGDGKVVQKEFVAVVTGAFKAANFIPTGGVIG